MPRFISQQAKAVRDDPKDGENVTLVIGYGEGHLSLLKSWVKDNGGEFKRELRGDTVLVNLPQDMVESLCSTEFADSVELNETIRVLDRGN